MFCVTWLQVYTYLFARVYKGSQYKFIFTEGFVQTIFRTLLDEAYVKAHPLLLDMKDHDVSRAWILCSESRGLPWARSRGGMSATLQSGLDS